ncbi:MAG TPA: hypothetical protein VJS92_18255 [Candidatus Polarisedimenticolaceae bacterium]|nr:hypothetical protein [Candidatus Polarisedimenticolaceae bacterium]
MMTSDWTRRTFLRNGALTGLGGCLAGSVVAQVATPPAPTVVPEWFPRQDPARVREMVGVSHGNFARVKELVAASPALAKANWDWGYGDWESALGAASHSGKREIARFLIDHGARPSLFSATMLGQLAVVRAFVEASPGVQRIPGPHGITLLAHAKAGGEEAREVLAYLESLGDADTRTAAQPLTPEEQRRYLGRYVFGPKPDESVVVSLDKPGLMIARGDQFGRVLTYLGDHTFHPAGAPAVRIRFTVDGERATEVAVYDPDLLMRARRVAD